MKRYFVNLTNGIEFMGNFDIAGFVRIQSSLLENKRWDKVLMDLDYTFLLNVALGFHVIIIDASQRKAVSRAIFQGVPWIRYSLNRRWFDFETDSFVRKCNCTKFFSECYRALSKESKNKLDYARKFINCKSVQLSGTSYDTRNDGNYEFYSEQLSLFCAAGNQGDFETLRTTHATSGADACPSEH